ncbi:uncharacterized protein TNCV_3609422 [Trichonephila clavipes]|nr:uncharacterized protein TNCV_3609422 [Trichonephila clavipes]
MDEQLKALLEAINALKNSQEEAKNELKEKMEKGQEETKQEIKKGLEDMQKGLERMQKLVEEKIEKKVEQVEERIREQVDERIEEVAGNFSQGEASEVLQTLPDTERMNLNSLYNALDLRFRQKYSEDYARLQMKTKLHKTRESLQEYDSEVERLASLAFSDHSATVRKIFSLQYFADRQRMEKSRRLSTSGIIRWQQQHSGDDGLFTKWHEAYPISDQEASTVAEVLVQHWISRFGIPLQLHSDQGRNFDSAVCKRFCEILAIDKTRTIALHPQSDGMECRSRDHRLFSIPDALRTRSSVQPATRCYLGTLGVCRETPVPDGGNASSGYGKNQHGFQEDEDPI